MVSQELLEKVENILKYPLYNSWEIQGFGMLRTYIEKDTRIQIWLKDFIVPNVTDIHTHPWNFTSHIFQGEIVNNIFSEQKVNVNNLKNINYDKCLILTGENAYVKSKEPIVLKQIESKKYSCGENYYHKKNIPHRIDFIDGTITILTKDSINKDSLAYSYVPKDQSWVSAAPRIATAQEIKKFIEAANKFKKEKG